MCVGSDALNHPSSQSSSFRTALVTHLFVIITRNSKDFPTFVQLFPFGEGTVWRFFTCAGPLYFGFFFFLSRHTTGRLYAFSIYLLHGYRSIAHSKHRTDTCSSFFLGVYFFSLTFVEYRNASRVGKLRAGGALRSTMHLTFRYLRYGVNFFFPGGNSWEKFSSYHINCCCCCYSSANRAQANHSLSGKMGFWRIYALPPAQLDEEGSG